MKKIILQLLVYISVSAFTAGAQDTTQFKPSGKIYGLVFGDYQVKLHADSALGTRGSRAEYARQPFTQNYNSFEIRRIYLGYAYDFSEKISARLTLAHDGDTYDGQGNRSLLLKHAFVKWKGIFKGTDLVLGLSSTPTYVLTVEPVWDHRSVESTLLDMRGEAKSSDLGISLQGEYGDGKYGYNLMLANNAGLGAENNPYKKVYADVFVKFMDKKIMVDLYGDYEKAANDSVSFPKQQTKVTMKAFIAYQSAPITVGFEIASLMGTNYAITTLINDTTQNTNDTTDVVPFGFSIFAHAPIIKNKLGAFIRYDSFDPDTKYNSTKTYSTVHNGVYGHVKEDFFLAGLDYTPATNVHIMPNVWINSYSDKAANATGKLKSDYDFVGRLTFFWKF